LVSLWELLFSWLSFLAWVASFLVAIIGTNFVLFVNLSQILTLKFILQINLNFTPPYVFLNFSIFSITLINIFSIIFTLNYFFHLVYV
jgi:hypothetical protein